MNLPGYDAWKTASPDDMTAEEEEIAILKDRVKEMESVLTECAEYFDNRSDVIDGDDGVPRPNREMQMLQMIDEVL